MNAGLVIMGIMLVLLQTGLPHRWAFLPLLIAGCHTPAVQLLGDFSIMRIIILVGLARAAATGQLKWSFRNPLDVLIAFFACIALLSAVAHQAGNPFIFRAGVVLNVVGVYLYGRAFLDENEALERLAKGLVLVLVPYALMMLVEFSTGKNPYRFLGARLAITVVREGTIRAAGTFGTPILSGTLGAVALPFFLQLWQRHRFMALCGIIASITIVFSSGSSGPIATLMIVGGLIFAWRFRAYGRALLWGGIGGVFVMQLFRERPIWYLMALMDFVGGSTGWHRANLIDSAYNHLDEWWFMGTDYTRHWMPYGLPTVPEHCDLTNYYIHLGVIGGLPLMFCLIAILWKGIGGILASTREAVGVDPERAFRLWCLAVALIAHAVTFLSISYYDQISVFFWILIGGLPGMTSRDGEAELDFAGDSSLFLQDCTKSRRCSSN